MRWEDEIARREYLARARRGDYNGGYYHPGESRDEWHNVLGWIVLVLFCLALIVIAAKAGSEPPEVTLEPVTVEMSDPIPCADDPEVRQLYVELGVLCRGGGK